MLPGPAVYRLGPRRVALAEPTHSALQESGIGSAGRATLDSAVQQTRSGARWRGTVSISAAGWPAGYAAPSSDPLRPATVVRAFATNPGAGGLVIRRKRCAAECSQPAKS